jgi:hypothetical protein
MSKYLDCCTAFAETMRDKYIAGRKDGNHLVIIARDKKNTIGGIMGKPSELAHILYGICMEDEDLRRLILRVAKQIVIDVIGDVPDEDEEDGDDDTD